MFGVDVGITFPHRANEARCLQTLFFSTLTFTWCASHSHSRLLSTRSRNYSQLQ